MPPAPGGATTSPCSHVHSRLHAGTQKTGSRLLSLPKLSPFRKFSFLSPTEDIHHFSQQRRGSHNSFPGFIKYVQEPICSCHREAEGEAGSPLSCAACISASGSGAPSTNVSLLQAELKQHHSSNVASCALQRASGGPLWGGHRISAGAGWPMTDPT